jgi:predicted HicB family RNase H-like nuclease
MPERSDALKKAQQKYMEKFSVARVRMERDRYERVQAHAAARGESTNAFIGRAITETMERDAGGPQEATGPGGLSLPPEALKTAQEAAEAAEETVPVFVARAIESRAKLDQRKKPKGGQ